MSHAIQPEHYVSDDRDVEREKQEILAALKQDRLLPDTQVQLTYHINAFLFLAFFPLGVVLYYYGKIFGPSLRVALTVFSMWWLNFTVIMFLMP